MPQRGCILQPRVGPRSGATLGRRVEVCTTPKGLWRPVRFPWLNPVGVGRSVARVPKVAASRQPWALGLSPVGAGSRRRRTEREHPEVSISLNSLAVGMRSERSALGRLSGFVRFYISRTQALSHGVATESSAWRKPWEGGAMRAKPRQGRQKQGDQFFRRSASPALQRRPPQLAPWATFWRCSAAHGLDSAPQKDAPGALEM